MAVAHHPAAPLPPADGGPQPGVVPHLRDAPALRSTERRIRTQAALGFGVRFGTVSMAIAVVLGVLSKLALLPASLAAWLTPAILLASSTTVTVLAGLSCWLRTPGRLAAAMRLDRSHGLHGLLASACDLEASHDATPSGFAHACVIRARTALPTLSPARAVPLRRPEGIGRLAIATLALAGLQLWPEPPPPPPVATIAPPQKPALLHEEDLTASSEAIRQLQEDAAAVPEVKAATDEVNALLESLADRTLDRTEALREVDALEARLRDAAAGDARQLDDALRELGKALQDAPLGDSLARALQAADAAAAARALDELADELSDGAANQRQRSLLQKRLLEAAKHPDDAERQRAQRQAEAERQRLLKKRNEGGGLDQRQQRLLQKKRRELEQLRRQAEAAAARKRVLEQLRRELGAGADALGRGQPRQAGQRMQRAGDQARQLAGRQQAQRALRRLQQRVQDLRELLRRGTQGDGERQEPGKGAQGEKRLTLDRFGDAARGKQGKRNTQGGKRGDGAQPGAQGEDGTMLQPMGPGTEGNPDAVLMMDGQGQQGGQMLAERPTAGREAGEGGTVQQSERPTATDTAHTDTAVRGARGKGPSRSEVILDAAARGFASRDYEQVHQTYEKHAEQTLERDEVPGGYRFYVRRYFQLIRGRKDTP